VGAIKGQPFSGSIKLKYISVPRVLKTTSLMMMRAPSFSSFPSTFPHQNCSCSYRIEVESATVDHAAVFSIRSISGQDLVN
jgi:hypothetical protein